MGCSYSDCRDSSCGQSSVWRYGRRSTWSGATPALLRWRVVFANGHRYDAVIGQTHIRLWNIPCATAALTAKSSERKVWAAADLAAFSRRAPVKVADVSRLDPKRRGQAVTARRNSQVRRRSSGKAVLNAALGDRRLSRQYSAGAAARDRAIVIYAARRAPLAGQGRRAGAVSDPRFRRLPDRRHRRIPRTSSSSTSSSCVVAQPWPQDKSSA